MVIFFCATCGATVPEQAIKSGMAVQASASKVFCYKCVTSGVAKVSDSAVQRALIAKQTEGGIRQRIGRISQRLLSQMPDNRIVRAAKKISKRFLGPKTGVYRPVSGGTGSFRPVTGSSPRNRIDSYTRMTLNNAKEKRAEAANMALVGSVIGVIVFVMFLVMVSTQKTVPTTANTSTSTPPPAAKTPSPWEAVSAPVGATIDKNKTASEPAKTPSTPAPPSAAVIALATKPEPTPAGPAPLLLPPLLIERDSGPVTSVEPKTRPADEHANAEKPTVNTAPVRSDSFAWFSTWQIENLEKRANAQMYKEFYGQKFVLETVPPEAGHPLRLKYKASVPADKPIFEFSARASDTGNVTLAVEIDGKTSAPISVSGSDWRTLGVDLSANSGQDIVLTFLHSAAEAKNDTAYWQAPKFVAKPGSDTEIFVIGPGSDTPAAALASRAAWAKAIDLLSVIDPVRDSVAGTWKKENGRLVSEKSFYSRLEIPYVPPSEYDLKVRFTRLSGNDAVTEIVYGGGRSFNWTMGGSNNRVFGFEMVGGVSALANPTTVSRPSCLENGKVYESIIQVRETGVKAFLDGQLISEWKTDFHDMDIYPEWKLRDGKLGLGCWDSPAAFHSILLLEMKGKGQPLGAQSKTTAVKNIKAEYETALLEAYNSLATRGLKSALARLDSAKSNPTLAPMIPNLDLDAQSISSLQGLHDGVLAGAAKLADGRDFTLTRTDGKQVAVGSGSANSVKGAANDVISIEQHQGSATASKDLRLNELSAQTQYDLAMLGMPPAEANLKIALVKMAALFNTSNRDAVVKEIKEHLDAAKKDASLSAKAEHLLSHLEFLNRDFDAQAQYKKITDSVKAADWRKARSLIEDFKIEYANSSALARVQSSLDEWTARINQELMSPVLKR